MISYPAPTRRAKGYPRYPTHCKEHGTRDPAPPPLPATTKTDGTHPAGMLSSLLWFSKELF